jgi:hypothetical protein
VAKNKHQRERRARELIRKKGKRLPFPRILNVCEGEKTEPQYFDEIRQTNRVPSAHMTVLPCAYGTQPRQVVDFAYATFFNKAKAFEYVFAVFDRDSHTTYHDALTRANALEAALNNDEKKIVTFRAIPSVPCFELWLLLHYANIQAYFECDEVFHQLRAYLPKYEKGAKKMYSTTEPFLADATTRANTLQDRSNPFAGNVAYTNVDKVVTLLRSIKASG